MGRETEDDDRGRDEAGGSSMVVVRKTLVRASVHETLRTATRSHAYFMGDDGFIGLVCR